MNGVALPETVAYFTSRGSLMGQVPMKLSQQRLRFSIHLSLFLQSLRDGKSLMPQPFVRHVAMEQSGNLNASLVPNQVGSPEFAQFLNALLKFYDPKDEHFSQEH